MLRIIPLGGVGHVTNNLFVYEYTKDDHTQRLIVDCGIGFPEEEMLGADLLVPDISYLRGKEKSIVGIVLTHGHDDHIAGLPFVLPQLNVDIPIYASTLTAGFAQGNLDEAGIKVKIKTFPHHPLQLADFTIDPITMTHSVPDTKHLIIQTPQHTIYHGSDFKLDLTPVDGVTPDFQKIAYYGSKGIDVLLTDCLRVEKEGFSLSESMIGESLNREMRNTSGKVIITTVSSNIHRIQQAINEAQAHDRKVAFLGRSIEEKVQVAQKLGFIKIPEGIVIHKRRIKKFKSHQLCLIVAGSQGQIGSTLARMASGEHTLAGVKPDDHIIFSADPIPGNEKNVYKVIDQIAQIGATVSYRDVADDLHVSGHASSGELRLLLKLTNPKHVTPIGGTHRHMVLFRNLAINLGIPEEDILLPKEGEIMALSRTSLYIDERIKLKTVIVDGLGIGDIGPLVLQDRTKMSQSGMITVAVPVDAKTNSVSGEPEIITRGFVFARRSREIIDHLTEEVVHHIPKGMIIHNWKEQRDEVVQNLERFVFLETQREPLILVVLVKS